MWLIAECVALKMSYRTKSCPCAYSIIFEFNAFSYYYCYSIPITFQCECDFSSCKTGKKCVTKLHNNNLFYIYYYGAYVFFPRTFPFLYFSFLLSCVVFFLSFIFSCSTRSEFIFTCLFSACWHTWIEGKRYL